MQLSSVGLSLIAHFEGLALRLYNDPAGHCTVGYGHLLHYGVCDGRSNEQPYTNGISEVEARALLEVDAEHFIAAVNRLVTVSLNQNQFDALVSFAFNVGVGALGSSTLLVLLNDGQYCEASEQLKLWVFGGGQVLPGLVRRREAERELFMREYSPPEGGDVDEVAREQIQVLQGLQTAAGLFMRIEAKLALNLAVPMGLRDQVRWILGGVSPNKQSSNELLRVLCNYAAGRAFSGEPLEEDTKQRLRYAVR